MSRPSSVASSSKDPIDGHPKDEPSGISAPTSLRSSGAPSKGSSATSSRKGKERAADREQDEEESGARQGRVSGPNGKDGSVDEGTYPDDGESEELSEEESDDGEEEEP